MKDPTRGVVLEVESKGVEEAVSRFRSDLLFVTIRCVIRDAVPEFDREFVVARSGWFISDSELVRWLTSDGLRGLERDGGSG